MMIKMCVNYINKVFLHVIRLHMLLHDGVFRLSENKLIFERIQSEAINVEKTLKIVFKFANTAK